MAKTKSPVGVGIIGSQFISAIHAESLKRCADARLLGVASPTRGHARSFARRFGLPRHFTDYQELLEDQWVEELRAKYPVEVNDKVLNKMIK